VEQGRGPEVQQHEETVTVMMMIAPLEFPEQSREAFGISGSDRWPRL